MRRPLGVFLTHMIQEIRADASIYLGIALYAVAAVAFLFWCGALERANFGLYVQRWTIPLLIGFPLAAMALQAIVVVLRFGRRRRLAFRQLTTSRRFAQIIAGMALVAAFMLFQGIFTSVKNGLTVWRGEFIYERLHADTDKILHFGVDPWRILHAFPQNPTALSVIEWNYAGLWFVIGFGALMFSAISQRHRALRLRYIFCFGMVWVVIGNLFAGLFISAGPAFYGFVTGDSARFAEQLAYLSQHSNGSAFYQDYLWKLHQAGSTGFASGISAFPSVHVGLAAMNALFAWSISRRLGVVAWLYTGFVLYSSVYLAWHYAIDGYVAIALAVAIYLLARRIAPSEPQAATA